MDIVYWNELMTRDGEKAKKFYGGDAGWTFDAMAMPTAPTGSRKWETLMSADCLRSPTRSSTVSMSAGCPVSPSMMSMAARILMRSVHVPGVGGIVILTEPGGAGIS
jgi:hypothetical protein